MTGYRVDYGTTPVPRDGRLIEADWGPKVVRVRYHEKYIAFPLWRDLEEFHRHFSRTPKAAIDPATPGHPVLYTVWFEVVRADFLPLNTFGLHTRLAGKQRIWEICVREDMVSRELVKELNDEVIPRYTGEV